MKIVSVAVRVGISLGMILSFTTAGYTQAPCEDASRGLPLPHRGISKRSRRLHQKP
jgi:hypothetical protein